MEGGEWRGCMMAKSDDHDHTHGHLCFIFVIHIQLILYLVPPTPDGSTVDNMWCYNC